MTVESGREFPTFFAHDADELVGMVHPAVDGGEHGVVIAVGGPQYRVGSHRQFLLLARHLAASNVNVLRFDYSGMGDSTGEHVGFENTFPQIRTAIDELMRHFPSQKSVTLWGLCDAASTIAAGAASDPRVDRVVLVNPWVRSETSLARTRVKHYYGQRLLDKAFWRKLVSGRFNVLQSLRSMAANIRSATRGTADDAGGQFSDRMADGMRRFGGKSLIVLCGADVTALEFEDVASKSPVWTKVLGRDDVVVQRLDDANHTFSRSNWRKRVFAWTTDLVLKP